MDKPMLKHAAVTAFFAIATPTLAMAGTDAADKAMAIALERAAEQSASQAADRAEAIANRVASYKSDNEASIEAAANDKSAACRETDLAQSALEIADRYYYALNGKPAGEAPQAYQSFVRANAACKRALDNFGKVMRGEN
jgi:hypothetical protein